jgi:hypothetical protein
MASPRSAKSKPVYPAWSDRCEHAWGISLSKCIEQLSVPGTTVEALRSIAETLPADTPQKQRQQLWRDYWLAARRQHLRFADLVAQGHYFTTGIRFPFSENPVREEIPPELYIAAKLFPETNRFRARGPHNELVEYVDVRVSARFTHTRNYDLVTVRHLDFHLNQTQAALVRRFHRAALEGEHEGLFSKKVLAEVGKKSGDIGDYFKDQPLWQFLITRVAAGRYRLAIYGLGFPGFTGRGR